MDTEVVSQTYPREVEWRHHFASVEFSCCLSVRSRCGFRNVEEQFLVEGHESAG